MLPKKMLLQPILGGEPKATDRAEESSVRDRTRSILSLQSRHLLLDGLQLQPVKRKFIQLCTVNIHSITVVITVLPQLSALENLNIFYFY